MYELHAKQDSGTSRKDRSLAVLIGLVLLIFSYGAFDSFLYEVHTSSSFGDDALTALINLLLILAIGIGGGLGVYGVIRGMAAAYLRLEAGFLEYRWSFWRWEQIKKLDLQTVGDIKVGDHIFYSKGKRIIPAILFTLKTDPSPTLDSVGRLHGRFFPLPKGVSEEEAQSFLHLIKQEQNRVSGGWQKSNTKN